MELNQEEQALVAAAESTAQSGTTGPVGPTNFPVISNFEVVLAPIFPQSGGVAAAPTLDPRSLPHPFNQLADAQDDGRGRTADLLPTTLDAVPRPQVLQGLFILITNPRSSVLNLNVVLEVNSTTDAQSLANDTLVFDLRTGAPVMGAWIAPAGRTYAFYSLSAPLVPGQTTNLACIPNFLKSPAPTVSVRGIVSVNATSGPLYATPEQRAVFYPTTPSDVFSTAAYCLTTRTGSNVFTLP